jgi:hypothetical protein
MVGADIRITNHIKFDRVCALGKRELEFEREVFGDGNVFDDEELPAGCVADDKPPIGQFFKRVEWCDNGLISLIFFIGVTCVRATLRTMGAPAVYSPLTSSCVTPKVGYELTKVATLRLRGLSATVIRWIELAESHIWTGVIFNRSFR